MTTFLYCGHYYHSLSVSDNFTGMYKPVRASIISLYQRATRRTRQKKVYLAERETKREKGTDDSLGSSETRRMY